MLNKTILKIIFALLLFIISQSAYSEKIIIQDEEEFWNVGVADLKTYDNESNNFFGASVSAYILNKISVCREHVISEKETADLKNYLVKIRLDEEEKKLHEKLKNYDKKYFTDEKNRKDLRNGIRDIRKNIRKIKKYKTGRIRISSSKEIQYTGAADNENLKTFEKNRLFRLASENSLEYLIHGKVNIFEDIVFTDIFLYSILEDRDIVSISRAFEINSFYSQLDEALIPFYTAVHGKEWSSITVMTSDKNADIYIDDVYSGTGSISGKITDPGNHEVKIAGTGIEEKTYSVYLSENSHFKLDADSGYEEEKLLAVNTFPDNADIYYDSLWQGKSPVIINSSKGEIFIRKEGFREKRILVEDIEENSIDFNLSPELFTHKDYLLSKRDDFYKNLSWFVLSAPVPFFMFAVLNDYTNSYNSAVSSGANMSEIDRLEKIRNYCYYGYYGTLFISISLFVNMVFHLNDYIEAGDILEQERK